MLQAITSRPNRSVTQKPGVPRRMSFFLFAGLMILSACNTSVGGQNLSLGKFPQRQVQEATVNQAVALQQRVTKSVNALRGASGFSPVRLDKRLSAAATRHARDMSAQDRPWHFGSDGSSPISRIRDAGYRGDIVGETISESFETDQETLAAWMREKNTRDVIQSPEAKNMGIAWYQEPGGRMWWVLVMAK